MKRAFTLIELLVVIGIILVLLGIVLPIFSRARWQSQIATQQLDFAAISSALESYKADFGDYPRNISLPGSASTSATPFFGLATALLGPGPVVTESVNGIYEAGDGADGFGFRTKTMSGAALGKVWGPYLQTDKFKVAWYAPQWYLSENLTPNPIYEPLLLDRWGSPIQYFTRFGPNSNRTGVTSVAPYSPVQSCTAGPLYGYSAPSSVDNANGQDAIWDCRDGTLQGLPTDPSTETRNESLAFIWMLGDDASVGGSLDNMIDGSKTLRYTGPYILISAGPNSANIADALSTQYPSPTQTNPTSPMPTTSSFCNFSGVSPQQYDQVFRASGNVYNFSRY